MVPAARKPAAKPRRSAPRAPAATAPPGAAAPEALAALRALAELGAGRDFVAAGSGEVAARLGVSQQTASRRLLELLGAGLVQRRAGHRKPQWRLTSQGAAALRAEFERLRAVVEPGPAPAVLRIRGRVATGLGEGAWYMARRGYRDAMQRLLGFAPYPGTLNLALDGAEAAKLDALRGREGLLVPGFEDEGRSFGAVKCFRARLLGREAAAVLPVRGHHRAVLEVVAPEHLRGALGLHDGSDVAIDVELG